MNEDDVYGSIFDAAAGYNIFLAELAAALVKNGALTETDLAMILVKQEMVNDHLPPASPALFGFVGLAEYIREKLSLPSREQTPVP